jgi:hypothetical protein
MSDLRRMEQQRAAEQRARKAWQNAAGPRQARAPRDEKAVLDRSRWIAIGVALVAMTAVVGASAELVLGAEWFGLAVGACVAAVALGAWYAVSGRTLGMNNDVRERVLERHYTGVAWYGSMLRTTQEQGGYERGLRRELTRLAAARVAERHGVNLYRDPQAASRLIGPDLWPLVDPAAGGDKPPGPSAQQPAARALQVPIRAVAELIDRLERM